MPSHICGGQTNHLDIVSRPTDVKTINEEFRAAQADNEKRALMHAKRGGKTYRCAYCGKVFRSGWKENVERHMHGNKNRKRCKMLDYLVKEYGGKEFKVLLKPVEFKEGDKVENFFYPTVSLMLAQV